MPGLVDIMETRPNWFSVVRHEAHSMLGACLVADETAVSDQSYAITISEIGGHVLVRETTPGEKLPVACYNRHVMSGGYFCLGLGYDTLVQDLASAKIWWSSLHDFLLIQAVAAATGRWPRNIELDHGKAGEFHQMALAAAAKLGDSEEYELALIGEPSWITDRNVRLSKDRKRLVNGRSPCPRGCLKKGSRVLRTDCCSRGAVAELIICERKREKALVDFWAQVRAQGGECCGTMIVCPLKNDLGQRGSAKGDTNA